jgi:BirA family biotin operon repressor/biotin-[acetyl-CoA-carboxylase] ligase
MYDLAALEASVTGTIFQGNLHFEPATGSTNSDAMAAARRGAPHGSVFFADEQTAGRGRGDHAWHSAVGQGLYVSVVLRLGVPAARMPLLPLAAGLAAAEAVREASGIGVDLRWPNDLLIGQRKTGGILAEAQIDAGALTFAVVGIGINVHQREFDPGLATPGTSLDLETGRYNDRQQILAELLRALEREASGMSDPGAIRALPVRLAAASTWVRGRRVEVHGPQACAGVTEGLDENGFLRVRTAEGLVTVQTGGIRAAG